MVLVFIVNILIVAVVVVIHYEVLYQLSNLLPRLNVLHRLRLVIGVFGALLAHALEVWVYAAAYYVMAKTEGWGNLSGNYDGSFMDTVYFSFTTYTSLGIGDIIPLGHIRFLTGIEGLTGLVLITWSASFLYIEMRRYWEDE